MYRTSSSLNSHELHLLVVEVSSTSNIASYFVQRNGFCLNLLELLMVLYFEHERSNEIYRRGHLQFPGV